MSERVTCGTSVCEFEFFEEEGMILAFPFGREGATEGRDLRDAVYMASDWLRMHALDELARGEDLFWGPLGNAPERGGVVIAVSVYVDLSDVPACTAAEAAKRLGVSTARVAQLCKAGELDSWRVGSTRMVSVDSVDYRNALQKRAGRPTGVAQRSEEREPFACAGHQLELELRRYVLAAALYASLMCSMSVRVLSR